MSVRFAKANRTGSLRNTEVYEGEDRTIRRQPTSPQTEKFNGMRSSPNDSFGHQYYADNPDKVPDKRFPSEKFDDLKEKLMNGRLEQNDKYDILIQLKSVSTLAFGESSKEYFISLLELAKFYNEQHRPESALRNLMKAKQLSDLIEINEDLQMELAIEIATGNIDLKTHSVQEGLKYLALAERLLLPFSDYESGNGFLTFKRDVLSARIALRNDKFYEAYNMYEKAIYSYDNLDCPLTTNIAYIYAEMGKTCIMMDDTDKAYDCYVRARDIFNECQQPELGDQVIAELPRDIQKRIILQDQEQEYE